MAKRTIIEVSRGLMSQPRIREIVVDELSNNATVVAAAEDAAAAAVNINPTIADHETRIATNEASTLGMPTVATTNYTRHLSRYASLAAAIADLPNAGAGGGEIQVDGEMTLTGTHTVPANVHLIGRGKGATVLQMPASPTVPMLKLDSANGALIADLAILLPEGTNAAEGAYGIHITGATDDVMIERVFLDRTSRGVNVEGWAGTTPGTVTNLTLRDVTANRSPSTFGFNLDDVDGVTLDNCVAEYNGLDGVKLRKKARNITFLGGRYNHNGTSTDGDGVDCYSGADTITVTATEAIGNTGNGITIKGNGGGLDPAEYGYVKNAQFVGLRCLGNGATGFYLQGGLVSAVQVDGGLFENNGTGTAGDGLYVDGRNVSVMGAIAKDNHRNGFTIPNTGTDTNLIGCVAIANSRGAAGSYDGFNIAGNGGTIQSCRAIGVDSDDITSTADYSTLTKYHSYGFRIASTVTGVWTLDNCVSTYHAQPGATGIRVDATSGNIIVTHILSTNPGTTTHGSIGSRAVNTAAATAADVAWVKTSGAPNNGSTGWSRVNVT